MMITNDYAGGKYKCMLCSYDFYLSIKTCSVFIVFNFFNGSSDLKLTISVCGEKSGLLKPIRDIF